MGQLYIGNLQSLYIISIYKAYIEHIQSVYRAYTKCIQNIYSPPACLLHILTIAVQSPVPWIYVNCIDNQAVLPKTLNTS